jgi:diadenosine tetraphosphatase ApaH/serine/threonine PP2A family protein phosphatase
MRLGIFSDVHANLEALTAALEAYKDLSIDRYICLGDTVGYGASPNDCCDLVVGLSATTVLGNHDAAVSGRMDYNFYYEACRQALDYHATVLSTGNMDWLKGLPYEVREENRSYCHGSPLNLEEFEYIFSLEQARGCLPHFNELADVTFVGHSHLCKAFALTPSDVHAVVATRFVIRPEYKYIIGVGSVGQPRDYDNRASITVFDLDQKSFEYHRVPYDIENSAKKIFESNLERNFGNRLFIGV